MLADTLHVVLEGCEGSVGGERLLAMIANTQAVRLFGDGEPDFALPASFTRTCRRLSHSIPFCIVKGLSL